MKTGSVKLCNVSEGKWGSKKIIVGQYADGRRKGAYLVIIRNRQREVAFAMSPTGAFTLLRCLSQSFNGRDT